MHSADNSKFVLFLFSFYICLFLIKTFSYFNCQTDISSSLIFAKINIYHPIKCQKYIAKTNHLGAVIRFYLKEIRDKFDGNLKIANKYISDEFDYLKKGIDDKSIQIMQSVYNAIYLGINCHKRVRHFSPFQKEISSQYSNEINDIKKKYNLSTYIPEVFLFHHGLRYANQKIRDYVFERDILDLGAYCGDSLLVLLNYTKKKVYSYEYSPENVQWTQRTIFDNKIDPNRYVLINNGIGNSSHIVDSFDKGIEKNKGKLNINITTIDEEVKKYNLKVGFMKADIEGMELQALQGAAKTIERDRPVISFSIYHNFEGLFDIRRYIEKFPNYVFEYQMGSPDWNSFGELIIFAYPKELS